jgi:hypothetical protein
MDVGGGNGADRPRLSPDRRSPDGALRGEAADDAVDPNENRVMRPITSEAALVLARKMLERGVPGIEQGPDGRLWALGVERRKGERREN